MDRSSESIPIRSGSASGSIAYQFYKRGSINDELLGECAALFSASYAVWGSSSPKAGQRVRISASKLTKDHLYNEDCFLIAAMSEGEVAGYAFVKVFKIDFEALSGKALWISQLLVSDKHRSKGIAKSLVQEAIKSCTDPVVAVGLVTSHPHAVRSLEKATGCTVHPENVRTLGEYVMRQSKIPYLGGLHLQGLTVNTKFYADHTDVLKLIEKEGKQWKLGTIGEGEEFLAIALMGK